MKFINIGFGNMLAVERIVLLAGPDSAPIKRMVSEGKEQGRVVDVSGGKPTKGVILTDSEHIVLSALSPETITARIEGSEE